MSVEFSSRPQWTHLGRRFVAGWVRVLFALLFVVGMFGASGSTPGSNTVESSSEGKAEGERESKDRESIEAASLRSQAKRRAGLGGPPTRVIALAVPPRSLEPKHAEPPRPSWQPARRSGPSDDDDDDDHHRLARAV